MTTEKRIQLTAALLVFCTIVWFGLQPATPQTSNLAQNKRPVTILLGGDVNMGRQIGKRILAGDIDYPFAKISNTLADADITFVNLESQLADLGGETQSPTNEFRFAGPPHAAKTLKNAGVDIVSIANNHMWDYGEERLDETTRYLEDAGVRYAGSSHDPAEQCSPSTFEAGGQTIAFYAITTLLNGYEKSGADERICFGEDAEKVVEDIRMTRPVTDWIFVSIHTGTEYKTTPNQDMVDLSHRLIDAGADGIIGHHPHVPQPIEEYASDLVTKLPSGKEVRRQGVIFYSLGNFAFWQPFSFWTQHSYLTKLTLEKDQPIQYDIIPVRAGWQPEVETDPKVIEQITELVNSH